MARPGTPSAVVLLAIAVAVGCSGGGGEGPTGISGQQGLRFVDRTPIADTIRANYQRSVVVELRDEQGRAISGASVVVSSRMADAANFPAAYFTPLPVGQIERSLTVITDGAGRAQFFMQLGLNAGAGVVIADAGGGRRDSLSITVSPGSPIALSITPLDTTVLAGREIQTQVVGRDWGGNDVGLPIDLAATSAAIALTERRVRGVSIGRAAVIASLGTLRDTMWVSVVPPATFAFYAAPIGAGQDAGIYLLDSDGSNGRFLFRTTGVINGILDFGGWPAWSADAKQIAFVSGSTLVSSSAASLRILDVAGGAPRDLVTGGAPVSDEHGPQFDRLGTVHFTRGAFGSQRTIWRVPVAGGTAVQESPLVDWGIEAMPSPNPAGDRIAYQTNRLTNSPVRFTLRLLDPASGQVQDLDVPGHSPRWSPSGDRIAYLDETNRVQFMTVTGTPIVSVSAGVSLERGFSWSPDGEWIVGRGSAGLQMLQVSTRLILPLALLGPTGQTLVHPSWQPAP
jgi:WD40-like Beta Propeller Repeat